MLAHNVGPDVNVSEVKAKSALGVPVAEVETSDNSTGLGELTDSEKLIEYLRLKGVG